MKPTSIFIKNKFGVTIELRQWGQDSAKWLDYNAQEWQELPGGIWEAQNWLKSGGFTPDTAEEIGRWSGKADVYETISHATTNASGFRNFNR